MAYELKRRNGGRPSVLPLVVVFVGALGSALVVGFVLLVAAQRQPRLECHEDVHNFADPVAPNTKLQYTFALRNSGRAPLLIADIVADCGCVHAKATSDVINPGKTEGLEVLFEAPDQRGQWQKSVTLFTNDLSDPVHKFRLIADIVPKLDVRPRIVDFGMLSKKQLPATAYVRVLPTRSTNSRTAIQITATSSCDYVSVQLRDIPGCVDKELVTVLRENTPSGAIAERLYVDVNDGSSSTMSISVLAQVVGDVYATPSTLLFGILQPGQSAVREVRLCRHDGDSVSIASMELSPSLKGVMSIDIGNDAKWPIVRATLAVSEPDRPIRKTQRFDGFIKVITQRNIKGNPLRDESSSSAVSMPSSIPEGESSFGESINIPVLGVRIPEKPSAVNSSDSNMLH